MKLFFITFAVVGRQPILSRLVDEKSRPELLPLGEWVKEALCRLKAEPCARFIRLLPYALPDRYDPSAEDSREIAVGDKSPLLAVLIAADGLASRILETR